MIYCGLPCIGKTTASKKMDFVIDLDSSKYYDKSNKHGVLNYILAMARYSRDGYCVVCSSHKEVRERLLKNGIDYVFVTYEDNMLDEVIKRSNERQPHSLKTEIIIENWDDFIKPIDGEKVIKLNKDVPFISDILSNEVVE